MNALLAILGLAIAGIDPFGAILLAGAIGAGLEKSKIIGFTVAVWLGAIATGTALSVIGIQFIEQIKNIFPSLSSSVWIYVNVILAVAIAIWLYRQIKHTASDKQKPSRKRKLQGSLIATISFGAVFGATSVLDPTFVAAIGVAAQTGNIVSIVALHTIWITISQFMLFGLLAAYLLGKHHQLLDWSKSFWRKHKPIFMRLVHALAFAVVILLIADSIVYLVSGDYLLV